MAQVLKRWGAPGNLPQSVRADRKQVQNSAGGFSFQVDDWTRLRRFLIMGTEGGTYYINEQKLTRDNIETLEACAEQDPLRVLNDITNILKQRRAPKPDYAIFALAYMTAHEREEVRQAAVALIPELLNTGSHLFQFAEYVEFFRGWGAALRRGVANWYLSKSPRDLAYQVTKYQQREGWSHRDLLRLSHPKVDGIYFNDLEKNAILRYVTSGELRTFETGEYPTDGIAYIAAVKAAKTATRELTIELIKSYGLTREMIQTKYLSDTEVQSALLEKMPMMALVRNLANLTRSGLFDNWSDDLVQTVGKLTNADAVQRSGIHPVFVLNALKTYQSGGGFRSDNYWIPNHEIVEALNKTFRISFGNIKPANKKTLIGLDVSGSMSAVAPTGLDNLSCAEAAAAMLMATFESEPFVRVMAFGENFRQLDITRGEPLDSIVQKTRRLNFGGTDCALPMQYALQQQLDIDTFIVYTDSETWAGRIHPHQALAVYRRKMQKPDAKLIVVGMASNGFSIADPDDPGMLDVVGFDSTAPNIMAQFARGEL